MSGSPTTKHKIAIVEDSDVFRTNLTAWLDEQRGFQVVAACRDGDEAVEMMPASNADLILLDIRLPRKSGIELIPTFKAALPRSPILMLTVLEDPAAIIRSFEAGADGYLLKRDRERLLRGIEDALVGGAAMSPVVAMRVRDWIRSRASGKSEPSELLAPDEHSIMEHIARGMTQLEVADVMSIALHDVKNACRRIYQKLRVKSAAQAVARLRDLGHNS